VNKNWEHVYVSNQAKLSHLKAYIFSYIKWPKYLGQQKYDGIVKNLKHSFIAVFAVLANNKANR